MLLLKDFKHKVHEGHKGFFFVYFVSFVFILSACLQSSDCFREDVFCAGLVTDTLGINDHGMNQDTWAGLEEAKANGLVDQIEYIESVDTRDYEKNIAYFAENGYDVIITTGIGMRDETLRASDFYLGSVFIGMNQPYEETRPNIIPVTFAEDQMGFVAGALAARISEIQIIGAVCETSGIDSMWRYCEGFRAGAKFTDEKIKVQVIYREDGSSEKLFIDETWGYDTAQKLIQRGVDVIFAAGGGTGQGALRAASQANVPAIGAERDQATVPAESGSSVVTSIFGRASFEVQNVIRRLKDGNISEPRLSQIKYVPLNQKFPESLTQEMDILLIGLWKGEIKTGVSFEKP
ncbi:MAG: BMP family ABC transporter substrate-binding protein [Chloroflexi bacterium]|nr:BMP family ABC transporter substrate-binding protein [Chloroflexota bacterium]